MKRKYFFQKVHVKAIAGNVGLFIHIPAVMSIITVLVSVVFKEYFSIMPLLITAAINLAIAQILYRLFFNPSISHLWDTMISISLAWFFCPLFASLPILWISKVYVSIVPNCFSCVILKEPLNAIFEVFSGFTSTGLSMVNSPFDLPKTIQWLRSFQQWIGGVGLIIFVLSLIEPNTEEYQFYFSESKTKGFINSFKKTSRSILLIYLIFTIFGILLFHIFGMQSWQAINHALSAIATGGFTITNDSFTGYSTLLKCASIFLMILGSMSFSVHYQWMFKKNFKQFWKNIQTRVYFIILIFGSILFFLLNIKNLSVIDSAFQWATSLATCGFYSTNLKAVLPSSKFIMIVAMIIGGCSGSTVGGLKIKRVVSLFQSISLRLRSYTFQKEKKSLKKSKVILSEIDPSGVYLPESGKTEKLYEASTLFFVWIITLFIGYFFLILFEHDIPTIDVLFDVTSALSNVGLSTGMTTDTLHMPSKITMILIMWLGRLEIIPILVLISTFFLSFTKKK